MSITPEEARAALAAADAGHHAVADEVGVPAWYWWGLAAGWVVLGATVTYTTWWVTSVCTLVFGAVHTQAFQRVASGRRRTDGVLVRRAVAGPHTALHVWLLLIALIVVTVAFTLVLAADGSRHSALLASLLPAGIIVTGGPAVVRWSARQGAA